VHVAEAEADGSPEELDGLVTAIGESAGFTGSGAGDVLQWGSALGTVSARVRTAAARRLSIRTEVRTGFVAAGLFGGLVGGLGLGAGLGVGLGE
jgi:hypothetical protein